MSGIGQRALDGLHAAHHQIGPTLTLFVRKVPFRVFVEGIERRSL
jgi:hypothetical protein